VVQLLELSKFATNTILNLIVMIFFIKKLLFKVLSPTDYLKTLHKGFYSLYDMGVLKKDSRFKYHYMVREIIEKDDTVVDIGANLGYFSKTFARLTPYGKLISIEPIPLFCTILKWALKDFSHVTIFNYALGTEPGTVTMVMPESHGMIRTGLPHIASSEEEKAHHKTQEVELVQGSILLANLDKLNYLKCDIEGFEKIVIPELKPLLEKHKPIVQIEIGPENEQQMITFFNQLGYKHYGIKNFKIVSEKSTQQEQGDFLFVHTENVYSFEDKMRAKNLFFA
jgi:FkbM family methyltransferase